MLSTGNFIASPKDPGRTNTECSLYFGHYWIAQDSCLFYPVCNVLSLKIKRQDIKEHIHYILEEENISSEPEAGNHCLTAGRWNAGRLVYFGSSPEFDTGKWLTTAISEEITGTISLSALDDYNGLVSTGCSQSFCLAWIFFFWQW